MKEINHVKNVDMLSGIKRPKKFDGRGKVNPKLSKIHDLNMAIDNRWVEAAIIPNLIQHNIKLDKHLINKVTQYKIMHLENGHQQLIITGSYKKKKTYYTLVPAEVKQVNLTSKSQSKTSFLTKSEQIKYNDVKVIDAEDYNESKSFPKEMNHSELTSDYLLEKINPSSFLEKPIKISNLKLTQEIDIDSDVTSARSEELLSSDQEKDSFSQLELKKETSIKISDDLLTNGTEPNIPLRSIETIESDLKEISNQRKSSLACFYYQKLKSETISEIEI